MYGGSEPKLRRRKVRHGNYKGRNGYTPVKGPWLRQRLNEIGPVLGDVVVNPPAAANLRHPAFSCHFQGKEADNVAKICVEHLRSNS